MKQYKIFHEYEDIKKNYEGSSLEKISGLHRSQYQVIKMCEYYSDSRYLKQNGDGVNLDESSRPRPFYNIVNYRVSLAKTATDLDIKDIQIISDNPKFQMQATILNKEVYEWMKENEFSKTLNLMGTTRPKYGGYLLKKTEDKDGLHVDVLRWTNVYTNQNDILCGPIVECHHMSPVDIKEKDGIWDNVTDVLKANKKLAEKSDTIDLYEIVGEFPISIFKDAEEVADTDQDEFTFSLQRYFIADVNGKKFKLYAEELSGELEDYYEYLAWEDNGFGLGRGVIEDSEEAQVWTNDSVINENLAMSLAGRVGIKTNSKKLGNSVLEHDHGKIYELGANEDMNAFSLAPAALGQYQNQVDKWKNQADYTSSSFDAATGEQPPSGTPLGTTQLLNAVASKPFDYKREEWGIHLTKIFDKWIIPYIVKKLKKEHILVSDYSNEELDMIDESFANYNANQDLVKSAIGFLKGKNPAPTAQDQQSLTDGYMKHVKTLGKKRFLLVPDEYFNDLVCKVTVLTTGEQKNKAAMLESLNKALETVVSSYNPNTGSFGVLDDPVLSKIFTEMVDLANIGVSAASLGIGKSKPKSLAPPPQGQPQPSPIPASQPLAPIGT